MASNGAGPSSAPSAAHAQPAAFEKNDKRDILGVLTRLSCIMTVTKTPDDIQKEQAQCMTDCYGAVSEAELESSLCSSVLVCLARHEDLLSFRRAFVSEDFRLDSPDAQKKCALLLGKAASRKSLAALCKDFELLAVIAHVYATMYGQVDSNKVGSTKILHRLGIVFVTYVLHRLAQAS